VQEWRRWHSYPAEGLACPHHRALGWDTCPMIHIFRTCPKLLHELENLPRGTTGNVGDAGSGEPGHAMDAEATCSTTAQSRPRPIGVDDQARGPVAMIFR
jgi:hypothetical protein